MNVINLIEEMGIQLKRVASCKGGEYHSPCPDPSCSGKDRFCIWPKEGDAGRYWCRRCERTGDAIQFCRDFMGMSYQEACVKTGQQPTLSNSYTKARSNSKFVPKSMPTIPNQWAQRASSFIQQSHEYLLKYPSLLSKDKDRGLTLDSIRDFQLGWNPTDVFERKTLWGLPENVDDCASGVLCLPKGIVIPSFRDQIPIRIKIRRQDWQQNDSFPKYQIVAGGIASPSIYGKIGKPLVLVEAELDAILIQRFASDICSCVALGGAAIRPDQFVHELLCNTSTILFALDFDDAGKKKYQFWKSTYSHIDPWPVPKGKSPEDAYRMGVDIREWIKRGLKRVGAIRPVDLKGVLLPKVSEIVIVDRLLTQKNKTYLKSLDDQALSVDPVCSQTISYHHALPEWDYEILKEIELIREKSALLPEEPFYLQYPALIVNNKKRFLDGLFADIAKGPSGPRARFGALQEDIRRVSMLIQDNKEVVNS